MLIYCSHKFGGDLENVKKAGEIVKELQINDLQNTYISPLHAFSFIDYEEIGYEEEMLMCEDLMLACDELLVISELSEGVKREIELAKMCKMPIRFLEND